MMVRAGSRSSRIPLDWQDPTTWDDALADVSAIFLVVPGGDDGRRDVTGFGRRVCKFVGRAQEAGVA